MTDSVVPLLVHTGRARSNVSADACQRDGRLKRAWFAIFHFFLVNEKPE